jgi:hypothetical protein
LAFGHGVARPVLRQLWDEGWVDHALLGCELVPTRMGMFWFEHQGEDVYGDWDPPVWRAVRVHALPTPLRRRLSAITFPDLDFRMTHQLRAGQAMVRSQNR